MLTNEPFIRLKQYPHFDAPLPPRSIRKLLSDPQSVAKHPFLPFIYYWKEWQPIDKSKPRKRRKIRYAARADAYIYSYYRQILSEKYEELLTKKGLSDCIIAYRKIRTTGDSRRGKGNIHFAAEAFDFIQRIDGCVAISFDISQFFGSLDHKIIKDKWKLLLGVRELPEYHLKVYNNIVRYAEVNRDALYKRLSYLKTTRKGAPFFILNKRDMPKQLCTPKRFRRAIAESRPSRKSLIEKNRYSYGIPQGAPISDLLANAYLVDFDLKLKNYVNQRGGIYLRYSDDILIVLPGDGRTGHGARRYVSNLIGMYGNNLAIKTSKTYVVKFTGYAGRQVAHRVWAGSDSKAKDGIEYLGFRFDGKRVYLRNSTLSSLRRKMKRSVKAEVKRLIRRYPGKDAAYLRKKFNVDRLIRRYGRVAHFERNPHYSNWTFWSYARKAVNVMGIRGQPIFQQLNRNKSLVKLWLDREIERQLRKGA